MMLRHASLKLHSLKLHLRLNVLWIYIVIISFPESFSLSGICCPNNMVTVTESDTVWSTNLSLDVAKMEEP